MGRADAVPTNDFAREAATPTALNGLADQRREAGRAEAEAGGAAIRYADGDAQRSTIVPSEVVCREARTRSTPRTFGETPTTMDL